MRLIKYIHGFSSLFFPQTCVGCDQPLTYQEELICTECWYHMPYTGFHQNYDNSTARQLWGRVRVEYAASFLFFRQESRVQQIMHHFKYKNAGRIGYLMGVRYARQLCNVPALMDIDAIVPVPLHTDKLRQRGYNQSDYFAKGLAEVFSKPVLSTILIRNTSRESQTTKGRYARHQNMAEVFEVVRPESFENKHILLVDDIFTTGATIEACASALLACSGVRVSVVTIARAVS